MKMSLATCVISMLNTSSSSGMKSSLYYSRPIETHGLVRSKDSSSSKQVLDLTSSIWTSPMTPSSSNTPLHTAVHLGTKIIVYECGAVDGSAWCAFI